MDAVTIGGHKISPGAIEQVNAGYKIERWKLLLIVAMLAMIPLCEPTLQFVLGLATIGLVLNEAVTYATERLTVRLKMRGKRVIVLPCLSPREVELTVTRVKSIAPSKD
jgi:membrane glycosyltransferase